MTRRQGRGGGGREGAGQAQPVHQARRRRQEREPGVGGQGPRVGRARGLHHQHPGSERGIRGRRLPPAVPDRGIVPDVQARPRRPVDHPPTKGSLTTGLTEGHCPQALGTGCGPG